METVGRITGQRPVPGEPAADLVLFQSLLAREKFEWVLQKGTEVGVAQFVPVLTERSLLRAKVIEDHKLDRWRRIVTEAAEQSQRGRIPKISQVVTFGAAVEQLVGFDCRLIAALLPEGEGRKVGTEEGKKVRTEEGWSDGSSSYPTPSYLPLLARGLQGGEREDISVALLIGPEGGFTPEEVALATQKVLGPSAWGRACCGRRRPPSWPRL